MAYGLRYLLEFDMAISGVPQSFAFNILQKDYTGAPSRLLGAAQPVLDRYQTDEAKPAIKGRNFEVKYINEGNTPLTAFYAPEDDTFKGKFVYYSRGTQLQFEGFLVQSDCSEILTDARHEVKLSFTDNLGLLKDVTLDQAYQPGVNSLQTTTENMYQKRTLLDVVKHCLYATSLQLPLNIYCQLKPVDVAGNNLFDMISVNMETFLVSESKWDNCYNVLEKILTALECTLVQAYGSWNIVRWGELRYSLPKNRLQGTGYNIDFTQSFPSFLETEMLIGINTQHQFEAGNIQSIERPFKYAKETFNYKNPIELLKNQNLKRVGALIRQYNIGTITGVQTYFEYQKLFFDDGFVWDAGTGAITPLSTYNGSSIFVRKIDDTGREIERYLSCRSDILIANVAMCNKIELSQNDKPKLSFSYKLNRTNNGTMYFYPMTIIYSKVNIPKIPMLPNSDFVYLNKALGQPFTWGTNPNFSLRDHLNMTTDTDVTQWMDATIEMPPLPFDGFMYVCFFQHQVDAGGETYFKDINFSVSYLVSGSSQITGHIHTETQPLNIKQNSDEDLSIDDSPRNSIAGTLFKGVLGNGYGVRSDFWTRDIAGLVESKRLGEIITFEQLFQNRTPRLKIDGSLQGLISNNKILSVLSVLNWQQSPKIWGVFGSLEIDYRNNNANFTFFEIYNVEETDNYIEHKYDFTFIYDSN